MSDVSAPTGSAAGVTREAFVSALVAEGFSPGQADGLWQYVAQESAGLSLSEAVDLAAERAQLSGPNRAMAEQITRGSLTLEEAATQGAVVAPDGGPLPAPYQYDQTASAVLSDVGAILGQEGFSDEAIANVLERNEDRILASLDGGASLDNIAAGLVGAVVEEDVAIQKRLLEEGAEPSSDSELTDQALMDDVRSNEEREIIEQTFGRVAKGQGMSLDGFINQVAYAFALHAKMYPGSSTGDIIRQYRDGELTDLELLSFTEDTDWMSTLPDRGQSLANDIYPAAIQMAEVRYTDDEGTTVTTYMNHQVLDNMAATFGGNYAMASIVTGQVHKALGSPEGHSGELERFAPIIAASLELDGTLARAQATNTAEALRIDAVRESVPFYEDMPDTGETDDRHPISQIVEGINEDQIAADAEFWQTTIAGETEDELWARIDNQRDETIPGTFVIRDQAIMNSSAWLDAMETYNFEELAFMALFGGEQGRAMADRLLNGGPPQTDEEVDQIVEVWENIGFDRAAQAGLFDPNDPRTNDLLDNMFYVDGDRTGGSSGGGGRTITANIPNEEETRNTYRALYRQLLLAEPSEEELSAFVAQINADAISNANAAAAAVDSASAAAAGNFFQRTGGGPLSDSEVTRIVNQFGVNSLEEARSKLMKTELYRRLYAHMPEGMDEVDYSSRFGRTVSEWLDGGGASGDFLGAQRRGMMVGGPAGDQVAESNAALSEAGMHSDSVKDRWARAAQLIADYY